MDKRNEKISELFVEICKINGLYRRWAQKRKLNNYMAGLFYALLDRERITQKEFCDDFEIPKQTISNIIAPLKQDGMITLIPSEKDRREKWIILTEKGKAHAEKILAPLYEIEASVIKKFGEAEMEQIVSLILDFSELLEWEMSRREK